MTWTQITKYCIRSQNGYQVARIHGRDRVMWEVWGPGVDPAHFKPGKQIKEFLGMFESGQEARDACEKHLIDSVANTRATPWPRQKVIFETTPR